VVFDASLLRLDMLSAAGRPVDQEALLSTYLFRFICENFSDVETSVGRTRHAKRIEWMTILGAQASR
jgi:hypothetical protein